MDRLLHEAPCADSLLTQDDPPAVGEVPEQRPSPFVLVVDHAGGAVPRRLGDLGLPEAERARHIAWDIGILDVARHMAAALGCSLVWQRYSRLVVDCNRRPGLPSSIPTVSDGTAVPGNVGLDWAARRAREVEILGPYHARIAALLDGRRRLGRPTVFVTLHSFTPKLRVGGTDRPWHVGLLFGPDDRFSRLVLDELRALAGIVVGVNEPYRADLAMEYAIPVHAEARRLPYAAFEVRQDLIADAAGAARWGDRLTWVLCRAVRRWPGLAARASDGASPPKGRPDASA